MFDFIKRIKFQSAFGVFIFTCCFFYLCWLSNMVFKHADAPKDISEIKMAIISIASMIVGFFFGSSAGSKAKDEAAKKSESTP